jgi:hypothetical protein
MRPSRGIIVVQDGVKFLPSPEKVAGLTHVIHEVKKVEPLDQPVQEFDPCATSNVYEGNVDSSASQVQYGSSFQSISQVKVKTLDDILSECEFLEKTRSRIKIFQKKGDYATVLQNFESLSLKGVRCIPVKGGEGKMGLLPDGRRIIARSVSTDEGCPTLEVQKSNGRIEIKIRYKDRIVSGK